jgi:hypothetical protein
MQYSKTPPLHQPSCRITIVPGGQTGADPAALDWAWRTESNVGMVPKGSEGRGRAD